MVDRKEISQALESLKADSPERKFNETIDLCINLKDVDLNDPAKRFRLEIPLPHPPNKPVKVAVIGDDNLVYQCNQLIEKDKTLEGRLLALGESALESLAREPAQARKVSKGYDYFVAIPQLMPSVGRILGKYLGPIGKMPTPLPPNINIESEINRYSRVTRARLRTNPVIHLKVGTRDLSTKDLTENIVSCLIEIERKLDRGDANIKSLFVKTTMGPSFKI